MMRHSQYGTIALVIPIYNAAAELPLLMPAIMQQSITPDHILVIDSSSTDNSQSLLQAYPVILHTIHQRDFDHGGTRQLATHLVEADIYIFLTQDAIPADAYAFQHLLDMLILSPDIACAYGRQLPKKDATPISAHARLFNYPERTQVRGYKDRATYGVKTYFNSDSFAAYKRQPLFAVGNFPKHLITGEDAYIAARLLRQDYRIVYAADATVYHSHNLSLLEEFHRYFSIGVFHGRERWLLNSFRGATGEGIRYVKSEWHYLISNRKFHWLPRAIASTFIKYIAYQLGLHEKYIPLMIKKRIGVNKSYWLKALMVPS